MPEAKARESNESIPIIAGATCRRCGGKLLVVRVERGVERVARIHRCQDCGEVNTSLQEMR
jgi:DNA-directed RNA polymerase subunit RPC12/RpoP